MCGRHTAGVPFMQQDRRNTRIILYFLSLPVAVSTPVFRACFVVHIVVTVYQRHILAKQSVVERIKAIE